MATAVRTGRAFSLLILLMIAAALPSCETAPPSRPLLELSYAHLPPIRLNVAEIEVDNRYRPPLEAPNVEHRFAPTPARAAEIWARDRLRAGGASGRARFVISRASVVETKLALKTGIVGAFTREQAERYDALLQTTLEILSPGGRRLGIVTSSAQRSRTVAEGISIGARERVWFEMTEGMMVDLDAELSGQIRGHLSAFVLPQ